MPALDKLKKEYKYKSEMLRKGQVHIKFPHIIYKRKSYDSPMAFFVHSFRLKGDDDYKIKVLKSLIKFMDALEEGTVDFSATLSYYPLYVLESRWLMKYAPGKRLALNKKGRMWLEAMKETVELATDENYIIDSATVQND